MARRRYKIDATVDSVKLAESKKLYVQGQLVLDMEGDKRLDLLVRRMEQEIINNGWDKKKHTKEISARLVELIHSDEFYGKYDAAIAAALPGLNRATDKALAQTKNGADPTKINIKEQLEYLSKDKERGGVFLKNYAKNRLVCKEYAAVTSYVLQNIGIENEVCMTHAIKGNNHAFVQIKSDKAVIETTDPNNPVRENLSLTSINDGEVVITKAKNTPIENYGSGKSSTDLYAKNTLPELLTMVAKVLDGRTLLPLRDLDKLEAGMEKLKEHLKVKNMESAQELDKAMGAYEKRLAKKPQPNFDPGKPISVEQAQENVARYYADIDKGKHLLGIPVGGKHDGQITNEEWYDYYRASTGEKVKTPGDPDRVTMSVFEEVQRQQLKIVEMDKNRDGILTPKEVQQEVAGHIKLTQERLKNLGKPLLPKHIERETRPLNEMVFGKY